ncbi:MAG TPA: ion channel [Thermoanaerobaculia bacterium]|nr:ion channel [Thermoanaerobaculia bacterium]
MATEAQNVRLTYGAEDLNRDLGFGSVVAGQRQRLLNRDGSFNVKREGLRAWSSLSLYHDLLEISWPRFLGLVILYYMSMNLLFAFAYLACGLDGIAGTRATTTSGKFLEAFFFSNQTLATIGYGGMHPVGLMANLLVTLESLVGLLGFALATGLLFARFSRPIAKVLFSEKAIIAPYRGMTAFEFRLANIRSNQLIQVECMLMLSWLKPGARLRDFRPLRLERDKVVFFPLAWTVVHPIDVDSPLYGVSAEQLVEWDTEFLILLTGIDETFAQTVHSRSSYKADEVVWGASFENIYNPPRDGRLSIDVGRLHEIRPAELPAPPGESPAG